MAAKLLILSAIISSCVLGNFGQDDWEKVSGGVLESIGRSIGAVICESDQFPMVHSVNHLGLSVAEQLGEEYGSFFFSPLGLSTALAMAYMGSRGQTARQFEDALKYTKLNTTGVQVHDRMYELSEDILKRAKTHYSFHMENALFYRSGLGLDKNYTSSLEMYYNATAVELDFVGKPTESLDHINGWVRNATLENISCIANEPLPPDTELFLTNVIYFKGTWKVQFALENTVDEFFHAAGADVEMAVPMMTMSKQTFRYSKDEKLGYKFLELPYEGEEFTMIFGLPLNYNEVPAINITTAKLCEIRSNLTETELDVVAIPRFKIEYEKELKPVLSTLGIVDAFAAGSADFSAMKSGGGIHFSSVKHKAVIEVNEQGSEAAAVSGMLFRPYSARRIVDEFVADHSFAICIIDSKTGGILFCGRVMEP